MKYLVLVLKGTAYGIAHILPGLGGGLMLILLGVYEQFVDTLGNFFLRRDKWGEYIPFLVSLGLGMLIATVAFAHLFSVLLDRYPVPTMLFFIGLKLGTIPTVLKLHSDMRPSMGRVLALMAGIALVVGIRSLERLGVHGGLEGSKGVGALAYIVITSFAAGCASVTPGLDGSYILLLAGTYEPILGALKALTDLNIQWGILIGLGAGAGLGIMVWSKVVDTAIKRAPSITYYVVLGLIVGSPYGLWPSTIDGANLPATVLAFIAGFALALLFGRKEEQQMAIDRRPEIEKVGG